MLFVHVNVTSLVSCTLKHLKLLISKNTSSPSRLILSPFCLLPPRAAQWDMKGTVFVMEGWLMRGEKTSCRAIVLIQMLRQIETSPIHSATEKSLYGYTRVRLGTKPQVQTTLKYVARAGNLNPDSNPRWGCWTYLRCLGGDEKVCSREKMVERKMGKKSRGTVSHRDCKLFLLQDFDASHGT